MSEPDGLDRNNFPGLRGDGHPRPGFDLILALDFASKKQTLGGGGRLHVNPLWIGQQRNPLYCGEADPLSVAVQLSQPDENASIAC